MGNLVPTVLCLALLLYATWNEKVFAEPTGTQPITDITFNTAPGLPANLEPWADDEKAAVIRAVDYWNEVINTTEWDSVALQGFTGTIDFDKDSSNFVSETAHANGTHVSFDFEDFIWNSDENTQLVDNNAVGRNLELVLTHELAHSLGVRIGGEGNKWTVLPDDDDADTFGTVTFNSLLTSAWGSKILAPKKSTDEDNAGIVVGEIYNLDQSNPFVFDGETSQEVYGDTWLNEQGYDLEAKRMAVISTAGGLFGHLQDPPHGPMTYRSNRRSFISEAEMSVMKDIGHDIDISNYFGRSLYNIHEGTIEITSTNNDRDIAEYGVNGWKGEGKFAVGLHIVRSDMQTTNADEGNTVLVQKHLVSAGEYGTGIRIEGWNHDVTIDDNIIIAATGEGGIGVLFTGMEGNSSGSTLNIKGTIDARYEDTLNKAIMLDPLNTSVAGINVTGDAVITGIIDILNDNDLTVKDGASLATTAGLEFLSGNLVMDPGSTLKMNLGDESESDTIIFDAGTSANIGAINTEVSALKAGTYTLIDSENLTFATSGLKYKGTTITSGTNVGHAKNVSYNFANTDNDLVLTITDEGFTNIAQNWTGTAQNNLWDTTSENWSNIDKTFADGDVVTFDLEDADHAIDIAEAGVTVADMTVNSSKNWVFNGNITGTSSTDISGSTGALTKDGAGSLTLNGYNRFNAVSIDGGTTVVTDANTLTSSGGVAVDVAGTLTGNGTVVSNVTVSGTLSAGDTVGEIGTLSITGDLTMADNSKLAVNLGSDETPVSDKISVTGNTTLGNIEIAMQSLFHEGTYTLVTSNALTNTSPLTKFSLEGEIIDLDTVAGRLSQIDPTATINNNALQLSIDAETENLSLVWTGDTNANWDFTSNNWSNATDSYFLTGDAVTFNQSNGTTHNITVGGTQKTVADMIVNSNGNWVFTGNITGTNADTQTTLSTSTGTLTKNGTGTLTLDGDVVFTGGAMLNAGRLHIGNGGTAGTFDGDITTTSIATLAFNRTDNVTYSDVISGAGNLEKLGGGTLILTGANTYTGTTNVTAGTLQIGNGGATGSIGLDNVTVAADTNLVFNRTDTVSINNTISGTGTTTLASGTLAGNGGIAGSLVIQDGATFSPGNSIGTFTVDGNVTFETGSTYLYEVEQDAVGQKSDVLVVNNGGSITIEEDATLDIRLSGSAKLGDEFQVIAANSSQFVDETQFTPTDSNGLFNVEGNWGLEFFQELRSDGYWIAWQAVAPNFGNALQNFASSNASNAARGIDKIAQAAEQADRLDNMYDIDLYDAITNIQSNDPQGLADAFAQLHGEVFASNKIAALDLQRSFRELIPTGREIIKLSDLKKLTNRWGTFTGGMQSRDNIGRYSGYDVLSTGVAVGIDRAALPNLLLGAALGYDFSSQDFDTLRSKSEINALRTMVYTSWYNGTSFVDAYGGYTKNFYETERNININTFASTARSKYHSDMATVGLDVGRTMWSGEALLTPSIGLHYLRMIDPDITETGGGTANLFVTSEDYESLRMPVGVKASRTFSAENGLIWTPEVRFYYVREWLDDVAGVQTSLAGFRESVFNAESGQCGRDSGQVGVGLNARLSNRYNFRFDYDFEFYKHTNNHVLAATLGASW